MVWSGESIPHSIARKKGWARQRRNSFSSIASRPVSHKQQKAFYVREMKKELAKTNPDKTIVNYYRLEARKQSAYYKGRV